MGNIKKMPWYSKAALKSLVSKDPKYKWDDESIDIAYTLASNELGFDPSMVNKLNILKAIALEMPKYIAGQRNQLLDRIGNTLFDAYLMGKSINKESLKSDISTLDEKYDIYEDEGIAVVNELIDRDLLYPSKMRELYFNKYQGDRK